MLGLIFASVLPWTIWLAKTLELWGARRRLARAHRTLAAAGSLSEAARAAGPASRPVGMRLPAVEDEPHRPPHLPDIDGVKEHAKPPLQRIRARRRPAVML